MPYYPTIEEDLKQAKEILERGKGDREELARIFPQKDVLESVLKNTGTIYGADIFTAYKLLESFIEEIERLQKIEPKCTNYRPDHNGECLNCDEPADAHPPTPAPTPPSPPGS